MATESTLLTPDDHTLMLIDHESQMAFAVRSHPIELVVNATVGLAKAAKAFGVPTIVTTVSEKSFSGPLFGAEVCVALPVINAIEDGYIVYFVADACGGVSIEAHERSVQRMIQAGAIPLTWLQYLLELQRDWARADTAGLVGDISKQHAGAYGIGIDYIYTMLDWDRAKRR
jgi:nicotinamidase-related amidase